MDVPGVVFNSGSDTEDYVAQEKAPNRGFFAARAKQANDFACVGWLTGGARFFQ